MSKEIEIGVCGLEGCEKEIFPFAMGWSNPQVGWFCSHDHYRQHEFGSPEPQCIHCRDGEHVKIGRSCEHCGYEAPPLPPMGEIIEYPRVEIPENPPRDPAWECSLPGCENPITINSFKQSELRYCCGLHAYKHASNKYFELVKHIQSERGLHSPDSYGQGCEETLELLLDFVQEQA